MFLFSNKLDLNQETRFTIVSKAVPKPKNAKISPSKLNLKIQNIYLHKNIFDNLKYI
jgi:hypothetical protein